ncbi:MAG: hypothetical protein JOZ12_15890 [Sinobacteraceae bacterium]|nr:hypothetical protein [Nevskiaceae bacterium]
MNSKWAEDGERGLELTESSLCACEHQQGDGVGGKGLEDLLRLLAGEQRTHIEQPNGVLNGGIQRTDRLRAPLYQIYPFPPRACCASAAI